MPPSISLTHLHLRPWIPVCFLPKFQSKAGFCEFLHPFLLFCAKGEEGGHSKPDSNGREKWRGQMPKPPTLDGFRDLITGEASSTVFTYRTLLEKLNTHKLDSGNLRLVCISGGGEFETVRNMFADACDQGYVLLRTYCSRAGKRHLLMKQTDVLQKLGE